MIMTVGPSVLVRLVAALAMTWWLAGCAEEQIGFSKSVISATPLPLDFGSQPAGTRTELTLQLTNLGGGVLTIENLVVDNDARGAFQIGPPPAGLTGGSVFELVVAYVAPSGAGTDNAALLIASNADNAPSFSVPLRGSSVAPSCTDEVHNGDESDVDCGGATCPGCPFEGGCAQSTDCGSTFACVARRCSTCDGPGQCREGQICEGGLCTGCLVDGDCEGGSTCVTGACVVCTGGDDPLDTTSDVAHCGGCNQACPVPAHALPICREGVCARLPCAAGWFDLDGAVSPGCEANCIGRRCDAPGGITTLSAPPLPEAGAVAQDFSSGAALGSQLQTSTRFTHLGIAGEASAGHGSEQRSSRFRHTGGLLPSIP